MKNTENLKKLLHAMSDFKAAYNSLVMEIDCYEHADKTSVNDLPGFTKSYPFDKSFDELAINKWVTDVIEGIRKESFKVLNYEYLNTGGNCMVGIFEVWLPAELKTVYVYVNEEGYTMSLVDYIRNELNIDDYDQLQIEVGDWGRVTGYERYFELYRHCLNEYTKSDCRYFGHTSQLPKFMLSDELQQQITEEYQQWIEANEYDTYETDGEKVIINPYYEPASGDEKLRNAIKSFQRWHDAIAGCNEYYEEKYKLVFADHKIELPFYADIWEAVNTLLETVINDI